VDIRASFLTFVIAVPALVPARSFAAQDPAPAPAPTPAQAPASGTAAGPAQARTQAQDAAPKSESVPEEGKAAATSSFTTEQLEQIVAPIALHPDSLLSMILMASTYPLEVVEAHRFVQKNPKLTGKALEEELKKHDWDPSIKAICELPSVLKQMNDNLDWTQDLGDAFLGQKEELMKTVQKMRRKAIDAGTLKSSEQQKVREEGEVIIIESTKTEVVYVPTYSPTVVYGPSWYYPTYYYPPMYVAPPAGSMFFAFSVGVIWGGAWGGCNWGGSDVDIDIDHHNEFNRNTSRNPERQNRDGKAGGKGSFQHNPEHRKGANYKNPQTAQKYGGAAGSNRVSKDQARGRSGTKAGAGAGTRPSAGTSGTRPTAGTGGGNRAGSTPSAGNRSSTRPSSGTNRASGGSSALSGSRSPGFDRSASSRGAASRGGGGGARRGGGGGGGRRR